MIRKDKQHIFIYIFAPRQTIYDFDFTIKIPIISYLMQADNTLRLGAGKQKSEIMLAQKMSDDLALCGISCTISYYESHDPSKIFRKYCMMLSETMRSILLLLTCLIFRCMISIKIL